MPTKEVFGRNLGIFGSEIAVSTSSALDTIVSDASEISGIIDRISAASEETAALAQNMNSQAKILQQLVSYFKL
ncbi:MAG: hypothetical protein FWB91_05180 [Defluviitaleaceae bacterium]|nr:hypothetical protein [Defluviitaleaceae bacterium]